MCLKCLACDDWRVSHDGLEFKAIVHLNILRNRSFPNLCDQNEDILKVSDVFVHNESPLGSNIQFIIWINTGLEQHTVQIENIWQENTISVFILDFKFNCYVPFLSSNLLYSQAISPPDFFSAWRMSKWRMFIFRWTILLSLRLSLQGDTSLDNLATVPLYAAPQTSCTWHGCVELTGSMKN